MLPKKNPVTTKSWQNLSRHYAKMEKIHMKTLFAEDPQRFEKFSRRFNDLLVDFSKNRITEETLKLLFDLANECGLAQAV